jgi:hypothetical protein
MWLRGTGTVAAGGGWAAAGGRGLGGGAVGSVVCTGLRDVGAVVVVGGGVVVMVPTVGLGAPGLTAAPD